MSIEYQRVKHTSNQYGKENKTTQHPESGIHINYLTKQCYNHDSSSDYTKIINAQNALNTQLKAWSSSYTETTILTKQAHNGELSIDQEILFFQLQRILFKLNICSQSS